MSLHGPLLGEGTRAIPERLPMGTLFCSPSLCSGMTRALGEHGRRSGIECPHTEPFRNRCGTIAYSTTVALVSFPRQTSPLVSQHPSLDSPHDDNDDAYSSAFQQWARHPRRDQDAEVLGAVQRAGLCPKSSEEVTGCWGRQGERQTR